MLCTSKEFRHRYGAFSEEDYEDFKSFYSENYDAKSFNTLCKFQEFIVSSEGRESHLEKGLVEWNFREDLKRRELEEIECYLSEKINHYFSMLKEVGYIYDVRLVYKGDSMEFENGNRVNPKRLSLCISDCVSDNSILEVKKTLSKEKLFKNINEMITEEILKLNRSKSLSSYEKAIKVVYDGMIIRKDQKEVGTVFNLAIGS